MKCRSKTSNPLAGRSFCPNQNHRIRIESIIEHSTLYGAQIVAPQRSFSAFRFQAQRKKKGRIHVHVGWKDGWKDVSWLIEPSEGASPSPRGQLVQWPAKATTCIIQATTPANAAAATDTAATDTATTCMTRRTRRILDGAGSDDFGIDPFACGRAVDLAEEIICMGGAGVDEARALKTEIEARL